MYAACLVLLAGQGMLLLDLLRHQSLFPAILGRYSVKFTLFLGVVLAALVVSSAFVGVRWRRLPAYAARLGTVCARRPGLPAVLFVVGAVVVGGAMLFGRLIAFFFPPLPFVVGLAVIYAGTAGVLVCAIPPARAVPVRERALLMLAGLAVGLGIGEAGLRLADPYPDYRILPANARWTFNPAPGVMHGITGASAYTTNAEGIRGDPYVPEGRYNVLAVGGSTTECAYLDDAEAWPYLLQQTLNGSGQTPPVWVGNVGRSGHALVEHTHALRYFVPQFHIDAVIMIVGVNDLSLAWWDPEKYRKRVADPENFYEFSHRSFYQRPLVDAALPRPFPENLAVWNLVEQGFWTLFRSFDDLRVEDLAGLNYVERRQNYLNAPVVIDTIPDFSTALDHYEHNLSVLIETAREQDLRLILVTAPVLWSAHLSPEGERRLWFGVTWSSGHARYSPGALARAMHLFNERLLAVCRATGTECVDLAAAMNGDERYFYDDVHFNEPGARAVADLLADYLKPAD